MSKIYDYIKKTYPKTISGFICIKRQEILVPYMELGINCLSRNTSELNLFFETILRLVEIGVKDISKLSEVLGLSITLVKEAIVDMVSSDYINVSEDALKITSKGITALKTRKLTEIKKANLNNVMVNLITGEIIDGDAVKSVNANRNSVCLREKIKIDDGFFDLNFPKINYVFQKQQESNNAFGKPSVTRELYKILSTNYQNLKYIKNYVSIYKAENSDELQFVFDYDKNDIYLNTMYEQLQVQPRPSLENIFERDWEFKKQSHELEFDHDLYKETKQIREIILGNDDPLGIDILDYSKKRYSLFEDEYKAYFVGSDDISFSKLYICSNRINSILTPEIYSELIRISAKKEVFILYDKNEFHAKESLKHFLGNNNENIFILPCDQIESSAICFDAQLLIYVNEYTINAFEDKISYKMPIIEFNEDVICNWTSQIANSYKLEEYKASQKKSTHFERKKKRH